MLDMLTSTPSLVIGVYVAPIWAYTDLPMVGGFDIKRRQFFAFVNVQQDHPLATKMASSPRMTKIQVGAAAST
jgi:hypothetical protein